MSVTLAKRPVSLPTVPNYGPYVRLAASLFNRFGDDRGVSLYEGLSHNDPHSLSVVFSRPSFTNYPTLIKGQSNTTEHASPVDYSDGYGHEYAAGE